MQPKRSKMRELFAEWCKAANPEMLTANQLLVGQDSSRAPALSTRKAPKQKVKLQRLQELLSRASVFQSPGHLRQPRHVEVMRSDVQMSRPSFAEQC